MGEEGILERPWVKWTLIIIVIIILVLAVILATLQEPDIQSKEIEFYDAGPGWVEFKLTIRLRNPNFIGGKVTKIEGDVFDESNDNDIGNVYTTKGWDVPGSKTSTIEVIVRIEGISQGADVYSKGHAWVEVFGQEFKVPYDTSE